MLVGRTALPDGAKARSGQGHYAQRLRAGEDGHPNFIRHVGADERAALCKA
jgi:hypothetical protein